MGGRAEIFSAHETFGVNFVLISKCTRTSKLMMVPIPENYTGDVQRKSITLIELQGLNGHNTYIGTKKKGTNTKVSIREDGEILKKTVPEVPNRQHVTSGEQKVSTIERNQHHSNNPFILSTVHKKFLQENKEIEGCILNILDNLLLKDSHHPTMPGTGISLAVESPYNPEKVYVNMEKAGYLKQYFGTDKKNMKTNNPRTTYRTTYGTGSGSVSSGIPPW